MSVHLPKQTRKRTLDMSNQHYYCANPITTSMPVNTQTAQAAQAAQTAQEQQASVVQLIDMVQKLEYTMIWQEERRQYQQQQVLDKLDLLLSEITKLSSKLSALEASVCQERYAIADLKKEISDLQTHAIHGAFSAPSGQDMVYM